MPVWGDYDVDLEHPLGRGGMSIVYRGRQVSLDRTVAIKVLKRDLVEESPEFVERFERESKLLAKLVDPQIVQVFGAGIVDGNYFYAMEFIEGDDLSKKLKQGHKFTEGEAIDVALNVSRALDAAWKHKIVHRDVKPSNVLITNDGKIKVMDFGLAKTLDTGATKSNLVMGTPKYIAPEQALGKDCDIRADLYSLGVVMYELVTGRTPFLADDFSALLLKHINDIPDPPSKFNKEISQTMELIIVRLLAKAPEARYQTPIELIKDLEKAQQGDKLSQKTVALAEEASGIAQKRRRVRMKVLATVFIIGVCAALAVFQPWQYWTSATNDRPLETNAPRPSGETPTADKALEEFDRLRQDALTALGDRRWSAAIAALEGALAHAKCTDDLRKGLEKELHKAQYSMHVEEARKWLAQRRFDDARAELARARQIEDTEEVKRLTDEADKTEKTSSLAQLKDQATEKMNQEQWRLAADKYAEALAVSDDPDLKRLHDFCIAVSDANKSLDANDLVPAREKFTAALAFEIKQDYVRRKLEEIEKAIRDKIKQDADAKIAKGEWTLAADVYEKAQKYCKDETLEPMRKFCLAMQEAHQAKDSGDTLRARELFKAAMSLGVQKDYLAQLVAELDRKIEEGQLRTKEQLQRDAEDKMKAGQWNLAAEVFEKLKKVSDDVGIEAKRQLCLAMYEADKALNQNKLETARDVLKTALDLNVMQDVVRGRLAEVEKKIKDRRNVDAAQLKADWQEKIRQAKDHMNRAQWKEAHQVLADAKELGLTDAEFENLVRRADRACGAPKGMCYVAEGPFVMGTNASKKDYETPEHQEMTDAFYIDVSEVTQAEYAKFLAECKDHTQCHASESKNKDHTPLFWSDQKDPAAPVVGIDWYDAWAYAAWVGKRLPTEVEFEKAAGWDTVKGKKRTYPWGETFDKNGGDSFFGCKHMGVGVLEWTQDSFKAYPGSKSTSSFFNERFAAVRGGIDLQEDAKESARVTSRFPTSKNSRTKKLGFRCAKDVEK